MHRECQTAMPNGHSLAADNGSECGEPLHYRVARQLGTTTPDRPQALTCETLRFQCCMNANSMRCSPSCLLRTAILTPVCIMPCIHCIHAVVQAHVRGSIRACTCWSVAMDIEYDTKSQAQESEGFPLRLPRRRLLSRTGATLSAPFSPPAPWWFASCCVCVCAAGPCCACPCSGADACCASCCCACCLARCCSATASSIICTSWSWPAHRATSSAVPRERLSTGASGSAPPCSSAATTPSAPSLTARPSGVTPS